MSPVPARHGDTLIFPASLDPDAVTVVRRLNEAGFEAYLVGGCVRDLLLGLIPKDFDVSTAARPRQIRRVFRNSRIIGRRFKLAHIHFGTKVIEVATFRRTPEGIGEPGSPSRDLLITQDNEFGNAEEDVVRRDFTINALLYDVQTAEVLDYVGGVDDLNQRTLRTIGDPATRFAEDPVRMLRAVKFLARLELEPDPALAEAMRAQPDLILRSSPARVAEEIYKLMSCGRADRALPMLVRSGLLERLLPEIAPYWSAHVDELARLGAALDRLDKGRRVAPNHLLLSLLFCGPTDARSGPDPDGPPGETLAALTELSGPMAQRMSIPRRDITLMRQLVLAQRRLASPRRGRRMRDFLERPSTAEAIDFLYLRSLAGCADPELHATWVLQLAEAGLAGPVRRLRHGAPGAGSDAALDAFDESADGPGRRRRRRTRGGRRRRGRQQATRGDGDARPFGPVREGGPERDGPADDDFEPQTDPGAAAPGRAQDDGRHEGPAEGGERRGRRRSRRGRGGRRRGNRSQETAGGERADRPEPAADRPADAAAESIPGGQEARPESERDSRPPRGARKRRRRGGGGRGGPATPGERTSQPQQTTRQPSGRRQRSETARPAPPGKSEEGWSPRRNPEDIEDVFDW